MSQFTQWKNGVLQPESSSSTRRFISPPSSDQALVIPELYLPFDSDYTPGSVKPYVVTPSGGTVPTIDTGQKILGDGSSKHQPDSYLALSTQAERSILLDELHNWGVGFWIYIDATPTVDIHAIIRWGGPGVWALGSKMITVQAATRDLLWSYFGGSSVLYVGLPLTTWTHIFVCFDKADPRAGTGFLTPYIQGVRQPPVACVIPASVSGDVVHLGYNQVASTTDMHYDDLIIFSQAIDDDYPGACAIPATTADIAGSQPL
tara:strand:+ start:538 stop:1320 length:783 start_codon:yes stop_codon:yes gene_type:complete